MRRSLGVGPLSGAPVEASEIDDRALVARAKTDRAAFAPLYARYLTPIYGYCLRRLGGREAAEDATSQVFAKALAALPRYDEGAGSFRGWLFAIAHNVVADQFRGSRPVVGLESADAVVDEAPTPDEVALANDRERELRGLLARLTEDQRQVVELRLAGLTDQEIAQALGRSHGAVRMSQHRAVTRLRALLGVEPGRKEIADGD